MAQSVEKSEIATWEKHSFSQFDGDACLRVGEETDRMGNAKRPAKVG